MSKRKKIPKEEMIKRLAFFDQKIDHYEEKMVDHCWYVKNFNRGTGRWQVGKYSIESYRKYKDYWNKKNKNRE